MNPNPFRTDSHVNTLFRHFSPGVFLDGTTLGIYLDVWGVYRRLGTLTVLYGSCRCDMFPLPLFLGKSRTEREKGIVDISF